ncbi:MAG: hypothetical protein E7624_00560 [Ruminococcaceae bacterium]|nr:hypothetical protein [Oscillospiraceae bacterium]
MKTLSLAQHRARIENIRTAEESNKKYLRRKRIHDYLSGQAIYNLGEYPAPFSIAPTEYDHALLADLAENGVKLIQIHEEWNDSIRRLGADKFSCHDAQGMKEFIKLCHSFGIKIIPYASTGFFHEFDPDFTEEFCRADSRLRQLYFSYRLGFAGSEKWRAYMLPRMMKILDDYEFDGLYNDMGYDGKRFARYEAIKRGSLDFSLPYDPIVEDLLAAVYGEIKSRGGVYKVHFDRNSAPPVKEKIYDYLWIGEAMENTEIGTGKLYEDYVVPCPDFGFNTDPAHMNCNFEYHYARTIPFLQFPLLTRGRPMTGKRALENIPYYGEKTPRTEYGFYLLAHEYAKAHPNGPHVYSTWSSIPPLEGDYEAWKRYHALYAPMVEENSVAYIELRECREILSDIPEKVYISMFVNEQKYLVVSNFTGKKYTLTLADTWTDRETKIQSKTFTVKNESIIFLQK